MNGDNEKKSKDAVEDIARKSKNKAFKKIKNVVVAKITSFISLILAKLLPLILITALLATVFSWLIEIFESEDTPEVIYNKPKNKFVAGFIGQMNFIDANIQNGCFDIEGHTFKTNKNIQGETTVAIRAEKMISGEISIKVKPEIVEMTGGERIVYFSLNGNKCSARVPLDYKIGEMIELKISVEDMYFFDKESGDVI